jgi:HSP20 family protein
MFPTFFDEMTRFPLFFEEETARPFAPSLDIFEYADRYELRLDLPGVAKDALKVAFEDGVLTVSGERKAPELPEGVRARSERWSGSFARSFELPDDADPATVEAKLADGVLALFVKKAEARKPRQISIS